MNAIYDFLYDNGFMPHGYCLLWDEKLVFAHVFSDATIALAYFSLPVFLYVLIRRRDDLQFNWLIGMFAAFILMCGITHLFNIWTLWVPSYGVQGVLKLVTAIVSIATAIVAWPLLSRILAIPSSEMLRTANEALRKQTGALSGALGQIQEKADALEKSEADLSRSNEALDSFAYIASHDLKAPLRAIDNLSQWIEEDLEDRLDGETRKNMTLLRGRVARMNSMLDDLLAYSRIGRSETEIRAIECENFVRETFDLVDAGNRFALRIEGDLPAFETAVAPLRLVLTNLFSNAIKHHNGDRGVITVAARPNGPVIEFTVSDDGPGIDKEHHERVFEMFQTLAPRDEVEGTGIGLAAVKKTIENLGGTISLESGTDEPGLTVRFTWPASMQRKEAA